MFEFVYATCQPASAPWLKEEARARHPELRFAFSRPGLVTFKAATPLPADFRLELAFARSWGFSFGLLDWERLTAWLADKPRPSLAQIFRAPLGEGEVDESPLPLGAGELHARWPWLGEGPPRPGDWILDVVALPGDSRPFVGLHRHERGRSPWPGGPQPVAPPPHAPSRAYSKLEEAIAWQELSLAPGQGALELGSAPGGAVLSLLERGLDVIAVDPAPLDATLAPRAAELGRRLVSLEKPAGALTKADLRFPIHWLLSDMNLAPQVALHTVERVASLVRGTLRGAILTLKMNDARAVASLPSLRARLEGLGWGPPRLGALPGHRREVVAVLVRP